MVREAQARVAALDLLRGGASLAVAVLHFFAYREIMPEAAEAISVLLVEVFFVLSGYVLASQILFCLAERSGRQLGVFLARRWMRTIPPYVIALLAVSVLSNEVGSADFFRYQFYLQNLFRQSNTVDYFTIAWSLSVEEWFYVAFPSLLLVAGLVFRRRGSGFAAWFGVAFCLAIAVVRLVWGEAGGDWGAAVRRVVVFRLDSIGYGFLMALAVDRLGAERLHRLGWWAFAVAVAVPAVTGYACLSRITNGGSRLAETAFPFVAAVFGMASVLAAQRAEALVGARPVLAWIGLYLGRVSYSTYLFHIILIEMLVAVFGSWSSVVLLPGFLAVMLGFLTLFYYAVEAPILAARPHYRTRPQPEFAPLNAVAPADRQ
jgi:peptidoglycan/LPS O-acetylase OafA/YrhL